LKVFERDPICPDYQPVRRVIHVGGRSGRELLEDLERAAVEINEFGLMLLTSAAFKASENRYPLVTVELTVRNLGFPQGAMISAICKMAENVGLSLCPVELGPHLRLQYLDQPEGSLGQPSSEHRAPPGSITIASEALEEGDDFPKGFYLRRIKGALWLRGYRSDSEHIWDPEDHLIFCER